MMDDEALYRSLVGEIAAEFPRFRVLRKDQSPLQRLIGRALVVVTLGGQRRYLEDYVTTLGPLVYVPTGWDERPARERMCTLRHERVHLRQFRRWGLVPMAIAYVLLPLPLGLAWCRMRWEREAYEESIRAACELLGPGRVRDPAFRAHIVGAFTDGSYGWMWPFPRAIERWYDRVLEGLPTAPPG